MKRYLISALILTGALSAQLGLRSLRGPALWMRDGGTGQDILVDLDSKTLALDPPGTAGGRYVLRAITQTGPITLIRQRAMSVVYSGQPITLLETPLPGTIVRIMWGGIDQPGGSYNVVGNILTLTGPGWVSGDSILVQYFY